MADANRLAAALRYQQDMEGPVTMNPNIAEQGRKGRANMAPPTSVMDPRSRDYERRSKETENFLIGADILAGALPFAPLAKGAAMAAGRYAGPKIAQGLEQHLVNTGGILPMDVYHGSPYKFDKFDMSKIGTGEGAQAYGHGLYLAEAKGVGTEYARALGPKTAMSDPEYVAAQARLGKFEDAVSRRYKQDALSPMEDIAFYSEKYPKRVISAADKIQAAEQAAYDKAKKGYLYKVDLPDEHIAKMLDWDKPLSQQSPEVQAAARKRLEELRAMGGSIPKDPTGEWIHKAFGPQGAEKAIDGVFGQSAASVRLREAGIPGIRYLDQGSRGASGTGKWRITYKNGESALFDFKPNDDVLKTMGATAKSEGTSNFVVFDDALPKIIGRE